MLRLKQALTDCGIANQALVKISGCSKALISRTLSTGALPPQDTEKFKAGVARMVGDDARLIDWLNDRHMHIEDLYAKIRDPEEAAVVNPALNELECALYELAGRAALAAESMSGAVIRMAQATIYLRRKISEMIGRDCQWTTQVEAEAAAILKGGSIC